MEIGTRPTLVGRQTRREYRAGDGLRVSELRPSAKYASHGVVRVIPPEETIRRVLPLLDDIGVTRVADVTGLDRVGIPNFTSVRPREPGFGISYYNGKGATRSAAKAGALMEALERHSGERCDLPVYCATRAEMRRRGPIVDPLDIVEPSIRKYEPSMRLEWVEGYDLLCDEPTFVPLNAVICPYAPRNGATQLYYSHTNGLASGNSVEEALCHAICEVLERDALSMADAVQRVAPTVARVLSDAGFEQLARSARGGGATGLIDLDTLPQRARSLVSRIQRAGLLLYLRDVTSSVGIAALDCACIERQLDGRHLVHVGTGCHPDARVAVSRAITEAAQSRLAHIQGGREDLTVIVRPPAPFEPSEVYGGGDLRPFSSVPSYEQPNVDDDIRLLVDRLASAGFSRVIAIDLTRPELSIPVIRVLIPGAETWSVFFTHGQRGYLGARANRAMWEATLSGAEAP